MSQSDINLSEPKMLSRTQSSATNEHMNSLLLSDLDKKVQQRFLDEIEAVLKSPPNLLGLENIPKSVHVSRVGPNEHLAWAEDAWQLVHNTSRNQRRPKITGREFVRKKVGALEWVADRVFAELVKEAIMYSDNRGRKIF